MTNSDRFIQAHKTAKQIHDCFSSYRDAFAFALTEIYAMERQEKTTGEWNTVPDWFQAKSGLSAYAFNDKQIVGETEKALKVRTAVNWGNGLSIIKEVWIPRSICKRGLHESELGEYGAKPFEYEMIARSIDDGTDCFEFSREYISWVKSCCA